MQVSIIIGQREPDDTIRDPETKVLGVHVP